jgi:CheY-like chemotaxis protein
VRFSLMLSEEPLIVRADPSQLHQVLLNLAVNARDAMPGGGTLTIATRSERNGDGQAFAVADVRDTGTGMDEKVLGHMFEPFFTTKGAAGTGLGLATVYGIVTQSGGRMRVTSRPGEGSVFSVWLPQLVDQEAAPIEGASSSAAEGGTETVLIVDDSEPVLALTSRILQHAGYQVLTAPSGEWALSVAGRHGGPIDLLLTDVMMPGMSGPQLARRFSALRPSTAVLYMTGYQRATPDGEMMVPAEAALIEKPFKPASLLQSVRQCLQGREPASS